MLRCVIAVLLLVAAFAAGISIGEGGHGRRGYGEHGFPRHQIMMQDGYQAGRSSNMNIEAGSMMMRGRTQGVIPLGTTTTASSSAAK